LSRLVVVSNRVTPPRQGRSGGEGGLAVAILAALKERGGMWFGWNGEVVARPPAAPDVFELGKVTCVTLGLSRQDFDEYYNGYANRSLWPLFHYRLDLCDFSRKTHRGYLRVNALFAHRLRPLLQPDDLIWVHDYHLIPMAQQLRMAGCTQRMGFFLHIPWPPLQLLLALPNHAEIVKALCAYDVVGFQTDTDLEAFLGYILEEAGGRARADGLIEVYGRRLLAASFPIGIDADSVASFADEAAESRQTKRLAASLRHRQMMIGVDRLDYSKGLVSRMEAYEHLLANYPANRGTVTLLQIAPQSREEVPEYMDLRAELESLTGRINARYAEFDWTPIRYLNKGFSRKALAGFFRISQVGVVTPLRDGMNLVAKEYVASQSAEDPGVLILSRFAGAARELDSALIVNPYDAEGVAESMQAALIMPLEERRERWRAMFERVRQHDVTAWREAFVESLSSAGRAA